MKECLVKTVKYIEQVRFWLQFVHAPWSVKVNGWRGRFLIPNFLKQGTCAYESRSALAIRFMFLLEKLFLASYYWPCSYRSPHSCFAFRTAWSASGFSARGCASCTMCAAQLAGSCPRSWSRRWASTDTWPSAIRTTPTCEADRSCSEWLAVSLSSNPYLLSYAVLRARENCRMNLPVLGRAKLSSWVHLYDSADRR